MLVGSLVAVLGFSVSASVQPNEGRLVYISQMSCVPAIETPMLRTDITFASRTRGEVSLHLSVLECQVPVFIR